MTQRGPGEDCPDRSHPLCCWSTEDQRPPTHNSEVAQLMQRIKDENEAAQRGMAGVAEGVARHAFINAHMDRMNALRSELASEIGDAEALTMICCVMLEEQYELEI